MARTAHFALHCSMLDAPVADQKTLKPSGAPKLALFSVRDAWMGAMVPKRWAKRAVTRNAIKRQIYRVSADFESALSEAGHVVRLRAEFDRKQFVSATSDELKTAVRLELQQLFAQFAVRSTSRTGLGGAL